MALTSLERAIGFADGKRRWATIMALTAAELAFAETDKAKRESYERQFKDCMATKAVADETLAELARTDDALSAQADLVAALHQHSTHKEMVA